MVTVRARVDRLRRETADATTLRLALTDSSFPYEAGQAIRVDPRQFVRLRPRIEERERSTGRGEEPRFYSVASHPLEKGILEITVKVDHRETPRPLLSPYLAREVREGDLLEMDGPFGSYVYPADRSSFDGVIHVAAGSGVVPNRSLIRYALAARWPHRHVLFLQDRRAADILYRKEWVGLARRHADRLKVVHALSARGEYLDRGTLQEGLRGWIEPARAIAFVCGPNKPRGAEPGFLEKFAGDRGLLAKIGVPRERVRTELW